MDDVDPLPTLNQKYAPQYGSKSINLGEIILVRLIAKHMLSFIDFTSVIGVNFGYVVLLFDFSRFSTFLLV
ncbi:hypothetical protein DD592_26560 [Enterobacter cloacae complex sp. 2DZ2F20B]|nr:hypothetical protein DD592_26560 [Enterobacter cloacae complex sp. 2DZ2F20B]